MTRSTIDEVGLSTLENLSVVDRLNGWMFESIQPFVKGRVLEIGSGIGNISDCFVKNNYPITLSDYSDHYCNYLDKKFTNQPLIEGIFQIDLADADFDSRYNLLIGKFDTVFALNVVEHIKDDHLAIANCRKLLKPGGNLIILVPAYQTLYNSFDVELEHFRRYTRKSVTELFNSQQIHILQTRYFNMAGILGWFVSGTILRKKQLPSGQLSFYNKLVPIFRILDQVTFNQVGLSVIIVGQKPE
ncbi:class I SAM-dependent methyltransferase [Chitinophaga sancti]|uniref:Class I SAM-dependent methyltransferase n=1 Tax=Chitinophaga sancti TaxID=1004 RepID=A0A1K1T039_9BACT|nr:class I SAM-dependent methyltransferase [Chitinophaga sancti]WQD59559.1 class I SAM-dependent methyltransferase [Chitinophaga sancti]WQG88307.1 class I SAM-dependent methyltransferase [Chitinophaga sancti]SFW89938.1 Methyltransferase domain-containing protein [Chitinophaga sancti]